MKKFIKKFGIVFLSLTIAAALLACCGAETAKTA